jgi:hypothetical protein
MHEIDRVLFFDKKIPKFDTRTNLRKKADFRLNILLMKSIVKQDDWNSHARVTSLLFPAIKPSKFQKKITMKINNDVYHFHLGRKQPSFVFITSASEIYQRLALRAAMAEGLEEFNLELSPC